MKKASEVARVRTGQVLTIEATASGIGWLVERSSSLEFNGAVGEILLGE